MNGDEAALAKLGVPAKRKKSRRTLVIAIALAAVALGVFAFLRTRGPAPEPYRTAEVTRGDVTAEVGATGTLETARTVQIGAEVSGRIRNVLVDVNDRVEVGQVVVEIDTTQLDAQLSEARANLRVQRAAVAVAQAAADEASISLRRVQALHQGELASEQELESAQAANARTRAEVESARARVAVSEAAVSQSVAMLEKAIVRSPISGVVLTRAAQPGAAVASQFQTPILMEIAEDLRRMELRVAIDEADVGRVRPEQRAIFTVDAYPDREFAASIGRVAYSPTETESVVTYEAVLAVDNEDGALRPGMTATARIVTDVQQNELLVPNAALRFQPRREGWGPPTTNESDTGQPGVWVPAEPGQPLRRVRVQLRATDGRMTAIRGEGVDVGMRVVIGMAPVGEAASSASGSGT